MTFRGPRTERVWSALTGISRIVNNIYTPIQILPACLSQATARVALIISAQLNRKTMTTIPSTDSLRSVISRASLWMTLKPQALPNHAVGAGSTPQNSDEYLHVQESEGDWTKQSSAVTTMLNAYVNDNGALDWQMIHREHWLRVIALRARLQYFTLEEAPPGERSEDWKALRKDLRTAESAVIKFGKLASELSSEDELLKEYNVVAELFRSIESAIAKYEVKRWLTLNPWAQDRSEHSTGLST